MAIFDMFKKKSNADIATDRLKFVLVADRAKCDNEMMENIKNEIIAVISKYMEIDTSGLDIQITTTESESGNGAVQAICANIPVKEVKNGQKSVPAGNK